MVCCLLRGRWQGGGWRGGMCVESWAKRRTGRGWRSRRIVGQKVGIVEVLVRVREWCYVDLGVVDCWRGLGRAMLRGTCGQWGRPLLDRLGRTLLYVEDA